MPIEVPSMVDAVASCREDSVGERQRAHAGHCVLQVSYAIYQAASKEADAGKATTRKRTHAESEGAHQFSCIGEHIGAACHVGPWR